MESRSLCGCASATGPVACMQPDRASAVMAAIIDNRNARATRTLAIPHSETALVLHQLWLTNRFSAVTGGKKTRGGQACASASADRPDLRVNNVARLSGYAIERMTKKCHFIFQDIAG